MYVGSELLTRPPDVLDGPLDPPSDVSLLIRLITVSIIIRVASINLITNYCYLTVTNKKHIYIERASTIIVKRYTDE